MPAAAPQDLPPSPRLAFELTEDQEFVIRKAAELLGWSVADYVLCTALDRAERDLYEHAAVLRHRTAQRPLTEGAVEALTSVLGV